MDDSILNSIKKLLGIEPDYKHFDPDLIMHINSVFVILQQLGVGTPYGFTITGSDETWSKFMPEDEKSSLVKSYMALRVKLLFDPPLSSAVMDSINRQINEFEWRLLVACDPDAKYVEGLEDVK